MCKRYKVRPQIDIPVGIFQLSRVIELEIDIDRLRSPSAPCAAYRPCPPLAAFATLALRSLTLPARRLRLTPRRLRLLALRSATPHSASLSLLDMAYRPKVWGLTPQLPDYAAVSPQRRPRFAHRPIACTWL